MFDHESGLLDIVIELIKLAQDICIELEIELLRELLKLSDSLEFTVQPCSNLEVI